MISVPDGNLSSYASLAHAHRHYNGMLIYCLLTQCSLALRSIYQHANTYKYKVWLLKLRPGAAVPDPEFSPEVWLLKLRPGAAVPDPKFSPEVWLLNNKNVHAALDLGYTSLK